MYFFLWGLFSGSMSLFFGGSDVSVGTFASQKDMAWSQISPQKRHHLRMWHSKNPSSPPQNGIPSFWVASHSKNRRSSLGILTLLLFLRYPTWRRSGTIDCSCRVQDKPSKTKVKPLSTPQILTHALSFYNIYYDIHVHVVKAQRSLGHTQSATLVHCSAKCKSTSIRQIPQPL